MRSLLRDAAAATICGLIPLLTSACSSTAEPSAVHQMAGSTAAVHSEHQHPHNRGGHADLDGQSRSKLVRLAILAARLHSLSAAQAAGFDAALSPCVASPEGGMGFHWGNVSRIDGIAQWDEPEALVFVPSAHRPDGVRLGAIEYIVPMAASAVPPRLFGQTFIPGGPDNSLWTLHVWLGVWNPEGLFEPWNPRVSCPA